MLDLSENPCLVLTSTAYRLDLAWINFHYPYPGGDQFSAKDVCETSDRRLCRTVDAAARVRLSAGYAPDIDNVSTASIWPLLEDGQNSLSHVDQSGHVR